MSSTDIRIDSFGSIGTAEAINRCAHNFGKTLSDADKFVACVRADSRFYFMCSKSVDLEIYAKATGFYIIDTAEYNDDYLVGYGLYSVVAFDGLVWHNVEQEEATRWVEMLKFTFLRRHPFTFYPESTEFAGSFECGIDGKTVQCHYLYEYMPQSRGLKLTDAQKRVSNLVYAFKDGKAPGLTAKIVSLAVRRLGYLLTGESDHVLAAVPGATWERHKLRYERFGEELSSRLKIVNGTLDILTPEFDRPQRKKGLSAGDVILYGAYNSPDIIEGKDFLLFDDIYTTGRTFRAAMQLLFDNGAKSITGVFLAKTILTHNGKE